MGHPGRRRRGGSGLKRTPDRLPGLVEHFAARVLRVARVVEFDTFWIGARAESDDLDAEARRGLKRDVGLRVLDRFPGKTATPERPEAWFILRLPGGRLTTRIESVFVYGRYRKYSRAIPQSKWPCTRCLGPDCPKCRGTGKIHAWSVEEMIADPIREQTGGRRTRMHAVGREDVDARMLGGGRPFVLEVERPLRRRPDLAEVERRIRAKWSKEIAALGLRLVDARMVSVVKSAQPDKSYRALCEAESEIPAGRLGRTIAVRDLTVSQDTPRRVLHRRKDRTRKRVIRRVEVSPGDDTRRFVLDLTAQSGTYVKEFVSGDEGRTRPSVSEMLGVRCRVAELDVTAVHWEPPEG